jgi:hypothetical protein
MKFAFFALTFAVLFSVSSPARQQPSDIVGRVVPGQPTQRTPPRDPRPAATQKVGTGGIRGMVTTADTGQPLGRAVVTLSGSAGAATAITDDQGRFEFAQLPAGRYTVSARKNLYLPGGFKQRRPNGPSEPVDVKETHVVDGVVIALTRYGAITGRVLDPYGEPAMNVQVHVMATTARSRRPLRRSMTSANDIGEYRIAHLEPGSYVVCAIPRVSSRRAMGPRFADAAAGRVTGSVATGVVTPGTGGFVGGYLGGAPDEHGSGIATCYPSTDLSQGQPLTLPAGQELRDIDLMLRAGTTGNISGLVVDATGQPAARASVTLLTRFGTGADPWMHVGGAGVRPDTGQFSFEGVAPGEYLIEAMVFSPNPAGGERGPRDEQRGYLNVTMGAGDLDGVVITVGNLASVTGRVVFEQVGDRKPPARVRVMTMSTADGDRIRPGSTETDAEYRFELRNIFGIQYLSAGEAGGFRVKAIHHRGRDVLDVPIDFKPGDRLTDVEVVLTAQTTLIEGVIAGVPNPAPGEYNVLMFAQDSGKWRPRSRFVRMAFIDRTTGRFRVENAPPEQYYVAAFRRADVDMAFDDIYDPEFLERLKAVATLVPVIEGDRREVSLTPITVPER